jgi:hypothetical protein
MPDFKTLFDFSLARIKETGQDKGLKIYEAFPVWFANMYFQRPFEIHTVDGTGDGKVDCFFKTNVGDRTKYHVINAKFSEDFGKKAPHTFYDEITRFWQAFANKENRNNFLKTVKASLHQKYLELFKQYDNDRAELMFLTNLRKNENQHESIKRYNVKVFYQEELLNHVLDHIEGAMPQVPPILLTGINSVLPADIKDTEVPTSIVFAKLCDFIDYMRNEDPYDLLFARNVRLWLQRTPVNKEIEETFRDNPREFVFSNNGITMLCENHRYDPGRKELRIENPRIVNGSQTLHSIRLVANPPKNARVMLKIIEIPQNQPGDFSAMAKKKKDIINKIAVRTNRQNPIKKWDLVSNDDFQNEIAAFFRRNNLFYERRQKEWKVRSGELKGTGIQRGPDIKKLTQYIAAFNYSRKLLGPVAAKLSAGSLFDEKPYNIIKETEPELVFQIYLLSKILEKMYRKFTYISKYGNVSGHIDFLLYSLTILVLNRINTNWKSSELTEFLKNAFTSDNEKSWTTFLKAETDFILEQYKKENKKYRENTEQELTFNNYFKSNACKKVLEMRIPNKIIKLARNLN